MTQPDAILSLIPLPGDDDPMLWLLSDGAIERSSSLSKLLAEYDAEVLEHIPVTLLVPSSHSTYRRAEPQGLEPLQELAVARIRAQEQALGAVQAAAIFDQDGNLRTASVDAALLQNAFDLFYQLGLTVKAAVPLGAALHPMGSEVLRIEVGEHGMLCSAELCTVDEPSLASAFFGDAPVRNVEASELAQALVALSIKPEPNLLEGMAVQRKARPIFSDLNVKWAKHLAVLAACLALAGGVLYWTKLQWAISKENNVALSAAKSIDPTINDINRAEAAINASLASKGIQPAKPSMLVAIVWQATKARENVSITDLSLGQDGLLSATLSAPETDSINAALLSIQRGGYQITATPRQDPSGVALVDLTVKAP
jgi:general secretion pathway protein L